MWHEVTASMTFDQLGNVHAAYSCTAAGPAHRHASMTMIDWLHANPTEACNACQVFPDTRPYAPLLPKIFVPKNLFKNSRAPCSYPENLEAIDAPVSEL